MHSDPPPTVPELVASAVDGDERAWQQIVDRHAGLVWSVVRGFRLDHATGCDVAQTVWLRLVEHLDGLRDPARLAGWLATTARRECLRSLRSSRRELPADDMLDQVGGALVGGALVGGALVGSSPEDELLLDERQRTLWLAVQGLSVRCQQLLRTMAYAPERSYAQISTSLAMPIGSIGPTRSRCLAQLRSALAEG